MGSWKRGRALVWLGGAAALAGAPFACGGDPFSAASGDGGSGDGQTVEGAPGMDGSQDGPSGDGSVEGGAHHDGPRPPVEGGVTVQGSVVDQLLVPMSGVTVVAQGAATMTDASGHFTLHGVVPPYVAVVVPPSTGRQHAYVFAGATRQDPTFQLLSDFAAPAHSATISGTTSTGTNPVIAGTVFADFPQGAVGAAANSIPVATGSNMFSGSVSWAGPSPAMATIYDLQWFVSGSSPMPTGYTAFASETISLTPSGTTWSVPLNVAPTMAAMNVTANASSGYALADVSLYVRPQGASIAAPIVHDKVSPQSPVSFVTPDISGATFVTCGVQGLVGAPANNTPYGVACRTGIPVNVGATVTMPTAPTFVTVPTKAGVGSTFSWNAMPNAVHVLAFEPATASTQGPALYVMTPGSSLQVPDLTALGIVVPASMAYAASVYGFAPFATVDDATGPTGYAAMAVALRLDQGPAADAAFGFSGVAAFTTQ